ncbi:MAG: uroporphyrinogen decarboxylase [Bacteroidota bacterium]
MTNYTEYIGYVASALVLVSFVMKNITYLRIINTIGCGFFIIYGLLLPSAPIIITNAAIVLVNLYYLFKMTRSEIKN